MLRDQLLASKGALGRAREPEEGRPRLADRRRSGRTRRRSTRLQQVSAELAAKIQAAQSHSTVQHGRLGAGLIWPVSAPITSPFGWRWGRMHEGIDLGAAYGTPIAAAAAGHRHLRRLARRLREPDGDRPRRRPRDRLRPPVADRRLGRPAGRPGRDRSATSARPATRPGRTSTSRCASTARPSTRSATSRRGRCGSRASVQVRQVPVPLVDVEAVADEELVRDGEADVPHRQVLDEPAVRPVEERDRCERAGRAQAERPHEVVERQARCRRRPRR